MMQQWAEKSGRTLDEALYEGSEPLREWEVFSGSQSRIIQTRISRVIGALLKLHQSSLDFRHPSFLQGR